MRHSGGVKQSMTMAEFFALPEILKLQEIQKRNRYGSPEHKAAFDRMVEIAKSIGAEKFLGNY